MARGGGGKAKRDKAPDRKPNRLLPILNFVIADLIVRSMRPIVVGAFMVYFVQHFMPTDSLFVWLALFMGSAGVWYVLGLTKTGIDKAFASLSRSKQD